MAEELAAAGLVRSVSWHPKTFGMGGAPDDRAYVLLFDETYDMFLSPEGSTVRQDGQAQLTQLERIKSGQRLYHIWLFFTDSDKKRASKTVYIPIGDAPED